MKAAPNKFLIGFGVVVALGCGGLGYLISNAAGDYSKARSDFESKTSQYNQLRSAKLYPSAANLKKLQDKKEVVVKAAEELQAKLAPIAFPLEKITPEQFQDKLRVSVSSIVGKARENGVKLPEKFYLGFDVYQNQPPKAEAAAPLWRQLKTLELTVKILLDKRVDAITAIRRTALPEESGAKPSANPPLVSKFPFAVEFNASQTNFREALNDIVGNNQQFVITRSVLIKNGNEKPTLRATEGGAPGQAAATVATVASKGEKGESALKYIVGTEKLHVVLNLEMVIFASASPK